MFVFILTCFNFMICYWKATEVALFPGQGLFDKVLVRKLHKQGLGWGGRSCGKQLVGIM